MSFLCTVLVRFLLCGIAHAQHSIGKMSVVPKCAVSSQKLLIVPGLQKLLEDVVSVQTFMEQYHKNKENISYNHALKPDYHCLTCRIITLIHITEKKSFSYPKDHLCMTHS